MTASTTRRRPTPAYVPPADPEPGRSGATAAPAGTHHAPHAIGDARVFRTVMVVAALVLAARLVAPLEIQKDQALQLEAALNLASGAGLVSTGSTPTANPLDVSVAPSFGPLTWWPPAFSLLVASLLQLGLPLAAALKLPYAAGTLVGWWGWGALASVLLAEPLCVGGRALRMQYAVAALLPLVTTPSWGGTDLFLWAGTAWVALLLLRVPVRASWAANAALAGVIAGVLYGFRYASLFLVPAGVLAILGSAGVSTRARIGRATGFAAGAALAAVPTVIYSRLAAASSVPEYVDALGPWSLRQKVLDALDALPTAASLLPGFQVLALASERVGGNLAFGVLCAALPLAFFAYARRRARRGTGGATTALGLAAFPVALLAFLTAAHLATGYNPFTVGRYYEPAAVCTALVGYWMCAGAPARSRAARVLGGSQVAALAVYGLVYLPLVAPLGGRAQDTTRAVLGIAPAVDRDGRPDVSRASLVGPGRLYSRKEQTRALVRRLHAAHPDALFFVAGSYQLFVYDGLPSGPKLGARLRQLADSAYWQQAYTSRAQQVFWVVETPAQHWQQRTFTQLRRPDWARVAIIPEERTEVYRAALPAGFQFRQ